MLEECFQEVVMTHEAHDLPPCGLRVDEIIQRLKESLWPLSWQFRASLFPSCYGLIIHQAGDAVAVTTYTLNYLPVRDDVHGKQRSCSLRLVHVGKKLFSNESVNSIDL